MQLLQAPDSERVAAAGSDGFGGGAGSAHGCDAGRSVGDGIATDGLFVWERMAAGGCINDQLEAAGFEKIDGVGTAFVDFEYRLARQARGFQRACGAAGGEESEAEFVELASHIDSGGFVAIIDADEERARIGDGRTGC